MRWAQLSLWADCESDAKWLVAPLSKIHGFVKAELIDELWASRLAALTNVSLLPLLLSEFANCWICSAVKPFVTVSSLPDMISYLTDKNGEIVRVTKIGALIPYKKIVWYHIKKLYARTYKKIVCKKKKMFYSLMCDVCLHHFILWPHFIFLSDVAAYCHHHATSLPLSSQTQPNMKKKNLWYIK